MTDPSPDPTPDAAQHALDLLVEASGLTPEQVAAALMPEALAPELALDVLARAADALTLRRPSAAAPAGTDPNKA